MAVKPSTVSIKQLRTNRIKVTSSSQTKQQAIYEKLVQQPGRVIAICGLTSENVKICTQYTVPDGGNGTALESAILERLSKPSKDGVKKK